MQCICATWKVFMCSCQSFGDTKRRHKGCYFHVLQVALRLRTAISRSWLYWFFKCDNFFISHSEVQQFMVSETPRDRASEFLQIHTVYEIWLLILGSVDKNYVSTMHFCRPLTEEVFCRITWEAQWFPTLESYVWRPAFASKRFVNRFFNILIVGNSYNVCFDLLVAGLIL